MSLPDRWLQCCIRFWNRILSLPVDDLYRDVLSDSVLNVGLARGLQERMCDIGLPLSLQQPHLPRINEESVAAQLRHRQQDSLEASLGVDPRTCRSEGAAICTYWRWFRRADGQPGHRLRAGVFGHASTSKRAHELLRFRLGCHTLPSVTGRRAGIPRSERICLLCMHGVGDEKHLVFECSALNGIRLRFPHLFTGFHTMSSFMNQAAQRDVMHFITDCLRTQP